MSKYNQIYSDLLASITTQRLERGARLPSETELMDTYQASRGTCLLYTSPSPRD